MKRLRVYIEVIMTPEDVSRLWKEEDDEDGQKDI